MSEKLTSSLAHRLASHLRASSLVALAGGLRALAKPHPARWHATKGAAILMAAGLGVGLLIAAQIKSQPPRSVNTADESRQVAAATIQRLEAEQSDLKKQISELRDQVTARQQQLSSNQSTLTGLTGELKKLRLAAGMVEVKGPGVRVALDDSAAKTVPADEDPAFYLVHEYQLRDVLNLLWASGAEAIALNGERIVGTSSIYCVGSTIMVNNTRMSPPFEFVATGNPATLEDALNNPSNLRALKTRIKVYGVQFRVARTRDLIVPAYNGSLDVKLATAGAGR